MYIDKINNKDISNYCVAFLNTIHINDVLKNNVLELLEGGGENKIAIELLCDCLYEDKTKIDKVFFTQLGILCHYLKIDNSYLEYLFENVKI